MAPVRRSTLILPDQRTLALDLLNSRRGGVEETADTFPYRSESDDIPGRGSAGQKSEGMQPEMKKRGARCAVGGMRVAQRRPVSLLRTCVEAFA
jgi:hypothetical protein